ncbi:MAG: sulfatase [Chloroflexota bacterium]
MKSQITRRDFLKLMGLLPLTAMAPRMSRSFSPQEKGQNVIIVVFDAFSAANISLYGYQRDTTPNLARLANRAIVYHNHFAGGNFTPPGTASLLTGTYPWTHRAFGLDKNKVEESFVDKNIFSVFQNRYCLAYTHNPVANTLLTQFGSKLSNHIPLGKYFLANDDFIHDLFSVDEDIATVSWVRAIKRKEDRFSYSLFLSHLYEYYREEKITDLLSKFPNGIPHIAGDNYFLLEDAVDWSVNELVDLPQPFIGYFHFMPPHRPYLTHKDFYGRFAKDGFFPVQKPLDPFLGQEHDMMNFINKRRTDYDEFILYVDREFGRFMDKMDEIGLLDHTWIVLTSDHGEMFERGIFGHLTPTLYQPVIHIPLLIFEPGRTTRTDIYSNTSAVDILPTLLHVTGQKQVTWSEGVVLPPFSQKAPDLERNLYVVQAKTNAQYAPLTVATTALIKGQYKLMYFFGYGELNAGEERIELYDLVNDPEELYDLSSSKRELTAELLRDLKETLSAVNEPYL